MIFCFVSVLTNVAKIFFYNYYFSQSTKSKLSKACVCSFWCTVLHNADQRGAEAGLMDFEKDLHHRLKVTSPCCLFFLNFQ